MFCTADLRYYDGVQKLRNLQNGVRMFVLISFAETVAASCLYWLKYKSTVTTKREIQTSIIQNLMIKSDSPSAHNGRAFF